MPLSESKVRSRKPLLTSHHSDSIIIVLHSKTVKRNTKAAKLAIASVSFSRKLDPKVFVPGDVTCFLMYEMHMKMSPLPPLVVYEVSG